MKKIIIGISFLLAISTQAQFSVQVEAETGLTEQEAILYTLNGSKDIIVTKEKKKNNQWVFKYPSNYMGMMKIYFPNTNNTISFISENKNVSLKLESTDNKIQNVIYLDESNELMNSIQENSQKKELILPALTQIKEYYKNTSEFGKSLTAEIQRLTSVSTAIDTKKHPFIHYYYSNYNKFLTNNTAQKLSQDEIITFIDKSSDMLESSSLLRPLLVAFLNNAGNANVTSSVDALIDKLNVETPRGQTVLSEFIDIFDAYNMKDFKTKYLSLAQNLKCTINDRLASTIKANTSTQIGAVFPAYKFHSAVNTTAKSIADVKADKKVIAVWSSTCSHCEKELPQLLEKYNELKAKNIQIIGLSLDTDEKSYKSKIAAFPWINDSELKGWKSYVTEIFNIHATPTYFILDANNKIISKPDHVGDVLEYFKLK